MWREADLGYGKMASWPNSLTNVELIWSCYFVVWSTYNGGVYFLFLLWSWPCGNYYVNFSSIMLWYMWSWLYEIMWLCARFYGIHKCIKWINYVIYMWSSVMYIMWTYLCDLEVILYKDMWYCEWKHVSINVGMWWS